MNPNDPFYNNKHQDRRCFIGWHNFNSYQNDEKEVMICKVCNHMQIPSDIQNATEVIFDYDDNNKYVHNKSGHQGRDGTINFDKTW